MPDISKCRGGSCDKKESCYRFVSKPNKFRQSYFTNPPIDDDGSCRYYWEIKPKDNGNKKEKEEV